MEKNIGFDLVGCVGAEINEMKCMRVNKSTVLGGWVGVSVVINMICRLQELMSVAGG